MPISQPYALMGYSVKYFSLDKKKPKCCFFLPLCTSQHTSQYRKHIIFCSFLWHKTYCTSSTFTFSSIFLSYTLSNTLYLKRISRMDFQNTHVGMEHSPSLQIAYKFVSAYETTEPDPKRSLWSITQCCYSFRSLNIKPNRIEEVDKTVPCHEYRNNIPHTRHKTNNSTLKWNESNNSYNR